MKRTKTITKKSLDHQTVQHKIEFKVYGPKVVDNSWVIAYWRERDRCIWKTCDEETKEQIKIRYGL